MESTINLMTGVIREKFGVTMPLSGSTDINEIGLDSLDVINLLFAVEERTGVKIPDEDIVTHDLRTLSSFASYIENRRS
jgi:acyl carrier protein